MSTDPSPPDITVQDLGEGVAAIFVTTSPVFTHYQFAVSKVEAEALATDLLEIFNPAAFIALESLSSETE